ncbi:MAG TPA: energy-coupling factor transporter transmembrane component T [Victivallales bacterium]|nr:energy-coupling factor transporter transmembrane component T [Victivallales bacterium]
MSKYGTLYVEGNSFFHKLDPSLKLLLFVLWAVTVFMFFDLRVDFVLIITGIVLLCFSGIPSRIIKTLFIIVISFNIINSIFILLISPDFGVTLAGHKTIIGHIWGYDVYYETLFYVLTISLKYISLLPVALIFIFTTHPSRFASSLNKVGIPYKLAYTFNIIFRYIPDIQNEFKTITYAQAARGMSFGKDEKSILKRIKHLFNIVIPLINSALERIDKVTNAMDLRGFGKYNKRTWYNKTSYKKVDYIFFILLILIFASCIYLRLSLESKFWCPVFFR